MSMFWPDSAWKQRFRRQLTNWFRRSARDLPWRRTRDLYRIWVSEVMLQQTQVATVIPYYESFLQAFPTLEELAAADEQQVLRQWEGLGYYRRARQLHQAARRIVTEHQGRVPEDCQQLCSLPGIGRYTAGAILSIGQDQRLPILEANTIRLYSRLLAYQDDPRSSQGQRILWEFAEQLVPRREPGRFNQALMELGSEVCTPKQPRCSECPVVRLCPTFANQWQDRIPLPARRTAYEDLHEIAVVVWRGEQILLRQCQDDERWAGLWDVPRFRLEAEPDGRGVNKQDNQMVQKQMVQQARRLAGVQVVAGAKLFSLKHGVTRYRITLDCYRAEYVGEAESLGMNEMDKQTGMSLSRAPGEVAWVSLPECGMYPLSATGRKLVRFLSKA